MIRYGPNRILTLCPSDMNCRWSPISKYAASDGEQAIYGHGQPFRKSRGYETMIPMPDGWSTMTSVDKTLHHNLRRTFRSGVGAKSLALFEPAILRNLEIYFSELTRKKDAKGWSSASDMRAWSRLANPAATSKPLTDPNEISVSGLIRWLILASASKQT